MEVIHIQIVCLIALFVIMTISGLIPILLVLKNKSVNFSTLTSTMISLCNCLAGGVFIGMCFLGLFPYVREKFNNVLMASKFETSFPISEFVVVIGFFLIMLLEQLILISKSKCEVSELDAMDSSCLSHVTSGDVSNITEDDESYVRLLDSETKDQETLGDIDIGKSTNYNARTMYKYNTGLHSHSHCKAKFAVDNESSLRHFILLLAVSIHSLFEGMALGLQTDKVKILHLFLAVLLHESLVVFALGVNIAKLNLALLNSLKYLLMVTGSIPVGILLGLLIGSTPGILGDIVSAVLQGVAAGIFIHVTFIEIIPEEFSLPNNHLLKVLFLFLGFMIMAAVNLALGDHK